MVHEAKQCVWKCDSGMVATHEELKEESSSRLLISQSWFKDIDEQYGVHMQKEFAKNKGYANIAANIDLDVTRSINTMHEQNANIVHLEEADDNAETHSGSMLIVENGTMDKEASLGVPHEKHSTEATQAGNDWLVWMDQGGGGRGHAR